VGRLYQQQRVLGLPDKLAYDDDHVREGDPEEVGNPSPAAPYCRASGDCAGRKEYL